MDENGKKKILIVDDDRNICRSLSFYFAEEGYLPVEAYSGGEAIKEAKAFNPDLIILDVMLPDMSGVEVCKILKNDEAIRHIPVIMLTAKTERVDKVSGLDFGADDYITKPYDSFELLARVRAHLRTKTLYDQVKTDERDYAAILDMTKKLTVSLNARDTLNYIVSKMAEITNVKRCSIVYIGTNKDIGYVIASHDDLNVKNLKIDITKYPEIQRLILKGREIVIYDALEDPLMGQVKDILHEMDIRGIVLFPITFEDDIIGTLILRSINIEKIFTEREIRLCQLIANVSAGPLKTAFLYEAALSESQKEKIARLDAEKTVKETQKLLKNILDNVEIGISFIPADYKIQFINPFYARLYDKEPQDFIGKECYRVFENRDTFCEDCPGAVAMGTGKKTEKEKKLIKENGEKIWLDVIAYPTFDIENRVTGFIYQVEDVTERKRYREDIIRYVKETEDANRALKDMDVRKTEFLNRVAHDLRTPLTSIKAYSELMLTYKDKPVATYQEFLGIIRDESNRMTSLINDYLDLMRLQTGRMEYRIGSLNLSDTIEQFAAMFIGQAKKNNIAVNLNIQKDIPLVPGDRDRINQALMNLMSNAIKFTPSGGSITISARTITSQMTDGKNFVEVSVADTGPGIPVDCRDKIFGKFFQMDDPVVRAKGGTGLGLAIVKEIVERHGGKVWAEASPSGGADIRFTIPVKE
ncbi:MAG: response regulator [Nitrospinae bacterium]|nr:response regulator [Nitrospinota bacterium]